MINFKNIHNRNVTTTEGESIWLSRSAAAVGVVFAITDVNTYVLISKRSNSMVDEPGKVCLPCGYLDWNETLYECMIREVYEETSLYLPDYNNFLLFNNNMQNFKMNDDPSNNKENLSFSFVSVYDFRETDKFPIKIESFNSNETSMVKWLNLNYFKNHDNYYDWAFNHDDTIKYAINFLSIFHNIFLLK